MSGGEEEEVCECPQNGDAYTCYARLGIGSGYACAFDRAAVANFRDPREPLHDGYGYDQVDTAQERIARSRLRGRE